MSSLTGRVTGFIRAISDFRYAGRSPASNRFEPWMGTRDYFIEKSIVMSGIGHNGLYCLSCGKMHECNVRRQTEFPAFHGLVYLHYQH